MRDQLASKWEDPSASGAAAGQRGVAAVVGWSRRSPTDRGLSSFPTYTSPSRQQRASQKRQPPRHGKSLIKLCSSPPPGRTGRELMRGLETWGHVHAEATPGLGRRFPRALSQSFVFRAFSDNPVTGGEECAQARQAPVRFVCIPDSRQAAKTKGARHRAVSRPMPVDARRISPEIERVVCFQTHSGFVPYFFKIFLGG